MDYIQKHPSQVSAYAKKCKRLEDIRRKSQEIVTLIRAPDLNSVDREVTSTNKMLLR
jgi:hypothetical protein